MRLYLAVFFFLMLPLHSFSQSNSGGVYRFLDMNPDARSAALGGNHTAIFNGGLSQVFLNPANLDTNALGKISGNFLNFLGEANIGTSATAVKIKNVGMLGLGIRFMSYGVFDELDEAGNETGTFHPMDAAISSVLSTSIAQNWQAGAGIELIFSSYANYKSFAAAVNAGIYYQNASNLSSFGITIRHLGSQIKAYDDRYEPLPFDVSVGVSKKPQGFPFHLYLTLQQLNNWDLRVFGENEPPALLDNLMRHVIAGGEIRFTDNFFIRLGYDHYLHEQTKSGSNFDFAGIAFGAGIVIKNIEIDISRNSYSKLGGLTQISIKTQVF